MARTGPDAARPECVRIVESDRLGSLATAWDDLVAAAPVASPFLRSWWLEGTSEPGSTFLLALAGERFLGGLAITQDRRVGVKRLRLMGTGPLCPDHLDLVAAPREEPVVEDALSGWLARANHGLIELDGVVDGSRLERVVGRLPGSRWRRCAGVAPWTELGGDFASYRSQLPSRLRNNLRRSRSRLDSAGVRYSVAEPEHSAEALDWLHRLHATYRGSSSGFLPGFDRFAAAAPVGIARGELVIHQLVHDRDVVAIQAWFEVDGRASFYQSGRDSTDPRWRGAGNVLHECVAERAYELGFTELDMLRGDEPYKSEWARRSRQLFGYRVARGMGGRAVSLAARRKSRHNQGLPSPWAPLRETTVPTSDRAPSLSPPSGD